MAGTYWVPAIRMSAAVAGFARVCDRCGTAFHSVGVRIMCDIRVKREGRA
jgi:hypothetical protein